jgi:hypothetical protein
VTRKVLVMLVLFAVVLSACSPGGGGGAQPPAPAGGGNVIVVTSTPTPGPQVPDNIPIMPGATDLNVTQSDISFVVKSDMQGVIDFYQKGLVAKGWKEQEKSSVLGDFGRMNYSAPDTQLSFLLSASQSLNQVVVRMSIIHLNVREATAMSKP